MNDLKLKYGCNKQRHRAGLLMTCLLIILTIGVFVQVRHHAFIAYDDDYYVSENVQVQKGITKQGVLWAFSSVVLGNWHPLTWLSHQLDVQLFGMNPGAHHLVNVGLHLLNALLLFFLLQRMTGDVWKGGLVAVLFAVHPLHVESVAWIAERKDVLSALFWMLTLLCYVLYTQHRNKGIYLLAHLCFLLGLLSKSMLVTLPFVMLLLDYWPLKRFQNRPAPDASGATAPLTMLPALVREKAGFFMLAFAFSVVTFIVQQSGGNVGSMEIYPLTIRAANALVAYGGYMVKMFWPAKLAVLYPHPGMPPLWKIMGTVFLLSSITVVAIKHARKYPWMGVGWLWYLGTLVPVIGLVQVGVQSMADRYTYIPLIGLFIMVVWGGAELLSTYRGRRTLFFSVATVVVLLLSVTAWNQVRHWSDSISLFEHAIDVTDDNYVMHNNLGLELRGQGRTTEALEHYGTAIRIKPDFTEAHLNVGVVLADLGRYEAAAEKCREVLRIDPNYVKAHLNLGNNRLRQGRAGEASRHYIDALKLAASADAYNGLGAAMLMVGKYEKAISYFRKALQLDPGHTGAMNNLNRILSKTSVSNKPSDGETDVQR